MLRCLSAFVLITFCCSCSEHKVIQDSVSPPIEAANPLDGTPIAIAWSKSTQLMMGLDTGATQSSLLFSPSVSSLGGRLRGRGEMRTTRVPISLKQNEQPITQKQDVVLVEQAPYDGLLGWACIKNYVWDINYPLRTHRFFSHLPARIRSWNKLKLIPGADYPQIEDKHGRIIIIDTGAPHAVYICKKRWEAIKLAYPDAFVSVYTGYSPAAGGLYARECMLVSSFRIGKLELKDILLCESFANPEVMGIPQEIDVILGYAALASRQFWLDGPNHTLYFSSVKKRTPIPTFNLVGGTFIQDRNGNGPLKAFVADWSPAWQSGLRTGDILVSINGRKNPSQEMIDYVTMQSGVHADIIVRRKDQLLLIQWSVPSAPPAGDYHPTPQAITEQEFEQQLKKPESKEQETETTHPQNESPATASANETTELASSDTRHDEIN